MSTQLVVIRTDESNKPIDPNKASKALTEIAIHVKKTLHQKEAIFHGKRQHYFKGQKAVDSLMKLPQFTGNREAATTRITQLMENNFFFRVHKQPKRTLEIDSKQYFEEEAYFIWQWESPWTRFKAQFFSFLLVAGVLLVVMFPLWPTQLRMGVWYLSMAGIGLIGLLFAIAIIRLILFVLTLALPFTRPGIWLFPNLFADVGFFDSFIPFWGWHGIDYERMHLEKYRKKSGKKKRKQNNEPSGPLLEEVGSHGKGKAKDSDEDEKIEEIQADSD